MYHDISSPYVVSIHHFSIPVTNCIIAPHLEPEEVVYYPFAVQAFAAELPVLSKIHLRLPLCYRATALRPICLMYYDLLHSAGEAQVSASLFIVITMVIFATGKFQGNTQEYYHRKNYI